MEYTQSFGAIKLEIKLAAQRIFRDAMTGEQCAAMFAKLDRSNPNIHEMVNRHQQATGNDRYSIMMDIIRTIGVQPPLRFCRSSVKDDSQNYSFTVDGADYVYHRGRGR